MCRMHVCKVPGKLGGSSQLSPPTSLSITLQKPRSKEIQVPIVKEISGQCLATLSVNQSERSWICALDGWHMFLLLLSLLYFFPQTRIASLINMFCPVEIIIVKLPFTKCLSGARHGPERFTEYRRM